MSLKSPEDTIAAISTPPGEGGIGIVRLSGREALEVAKAVFVSSSGRDIAADGGRVFHGHVVDAGRAVLDEVLVHVMRAPHSYTREDVVEINAHGGPGPLNAILEQTLLHGARLAQPGEFTLRAFLNGRIDLVQAEAVIDRIRARTRASLRAGAAAASGALSKSLHEIGAVLVEALAHIEAAVDFPDEDLPDLVNDALRQRLVEARDRMQSLLDTAETGRLYREGAAIAIAGRPNVGKSSLFNALLRDARAIVSAQPGTTRDRLEETISLAGVPVRLTDTAGLRATNDEVEQMGVDIARDALREADIVLFVVDASEPPRAEDAALEHELESLDRPVWLVLNKIDLELRPTRTNTDEHGRTRTNCSGAVRVGSSGSVPVRVGPCSSVPVRVCPFPAGTTRLSAKTGEGLDDLEKALAALLLGGAALSPDQGMITRAHQRDSLRRAAAAVHNVIENFGASPELLSIDLREAVQALGEITGETTPEDLLQTIFSSFCIGK